MKHNKNKKNAVIMFFFILIFSSFIFYMTNMTGSGTAAAEQFVREPGVQALGVCPPFFLRDENNEIINPVKGINAGKPYSPKRTCGACHDYAAITEAYHFQQGRGEKPDPRQAKRAQWATSPGNYGGAYCAPAPLYSYLSPKNNASPRTMDMTSYTFVKKCGVCHPGGGPLEFDRAGKRYDAFMADAGNDIVSGANKIFDGDYFKANWVKSGVAEADCLMCHLPSYNYSKRAGQIQQLNFKWAATVGAGFAKIVGAVAEGKTPAVRYNTDMFLPDGRVELSIIKHPRNGACLSCHAQPGVKKRGANFSARTDVHIRAGLKCVDCHTSGSSSKNQKNNKKYDHNFGKGDDPGTLARNDLDNTVVTCRDCHFTGNLGAPMPRHRGISPIHLEKISCQTCHIPERTTRASQFMASDVFNPGSRIKPDVKKVWTFYGPDMKLYNHYGYLNMMGYDDKPNFTYRPVYVRYQGKIYPVNRTHSAWPAIRTKGKQGLMQPRMTDVYKMWDDFKKDPSSYPELAKIKDDNNDHVVEINRPEEINALILSITTMLTKTKYPMDGKQVVWVMNDKVYESGTKFSRIPKEQWEASPYANVHKYSHDVFPARAALGVRGCAQCHSSQAAIFHQEITVYPFDENTRPVMAGNHEILGYSSVSLALMSILQNGIKPISMWGIGILVLVLLLHFIIIGPRVVDNNAEVETHLERYNVNERVVHYAAMVVFVFLGISGFMTFWSAGFDSDTIGSIYRFHYIVGLFLIVIGVVKLIMWQEHARFEHFDREWLRRFGGYFGKTDKVEAGKFNAGQKIFFIFMIASVFLLGVTGIVLLIVANSNVRMVVHFVHDVSAIVFTIAIITHAYLGVMANPGSLKAIIRGTVTREWARHHHSKWIED